MTAARLFRNGQSQAVRIPKSMEFQDVEEVEIERLADVITLRPRRKDWLSFAEELDAIDGQAGEVSDAQRREALEGFLRERPELFAAREVKLAVDGEK